jgi:hypothetical protein
MAEPDSDREDSENEDGDDEDGDDEDGHAFALDDEFDDRVIVGETSFTRDDFLNARRSLPGAKAPFILVPIAAMYVLFSFLADHQQGALAAMLVTPIAFTAVFVFAMWNGTRRWANNVFAELRGDHDVTFRFDRYGLAVETSKRQAKVAWEVLHRALETKLAFLVYTSANTAEVVPKRAFAASDLETLRQWLRERIQARPVRRVLLNTFVLWIVLIFAFLLIWQFLNGDHSSR